MTSKFHPLSRAAFIGFDSILKELDMISSQAKDNYPPYNVVKLNENTFVIELAVAGFKQEDLHIELKDNILMIKGDREQRREQDLYVHKGISARKIVKSFRLSEFTEVVGADLCNGILTIDLEVNLPKEESPRVIQIGSE